MNETLKVVFDTQVFLRALINPESGCGKLFHIWQDYYALHVTDAIEAEITDVLNRPKVREKFPQINDKAVSFIHQILRGAYRVKSDEPVKAISRDPKDDIFLACAKVANAGYLVTEDNDLLVLKQHHSTEIVNVTTFLTVLEARPSNS